MRHLRLSGDASLSFAHSLAIAALDLVGDVGPLQALERLAALPVETPIPLLDLLNEMPEAEREETLSAFATRAASPLSRAHSIALLRRYSVGAEVVVEHLSQFLADGRERVEAFITVLRWAERVFERRTEWQALPRASRLALVWAHADRITQLLFDGGAPPGHIVREIGPWDARAFVPWLLHSPAEESDPASPEHQHAPALWFRLLGYALGEEVQAWLPLEMVAAMRATISMDTGETGLWPDRFLIAEYDDTNALESFLARPWPYLARALDEQGLGERLTTDFAVQVLDQVLAALEQDSRGEVGWGVLIAAYQAGVLSARDPRLIQLLTHVDLAALVSADEEFGLTATIWASGVACASDNEVFQAAIEQAVIATARGLAERYPSPPRRRHENDPAWHRVACVVEAAATLCRIARPEQVAARLAELVPKLVLAWPSTALVWRDALELAARDLPFEAAAPLWPVLLELRARREY